MSITYQEVKQQYIALQQTFDYMQSKRDDIVEFVRSRSIGSAVFAGCGSSYCLGESAALSFRLRASLPSVALAGGDLMLNSSAYRPLFDRALLVAPSRSGSTSEVVEAVRLARRHRDVPVLAIACVEHSPLAKEADLALTLPWAFDHSVCQTRTVVNLYAANLLIAAYLGGDDALVADIRTAIEHGDAYMARVEATIRRAAGGDWTNAVVLADGELYGLASEGAIALTEIAKAQAHAYHLLDVRHGPMVTVGADTLVIAAIGGDGTKHQHNVLRDLKNRGARVLAFAGRAEAVPAELTDVSIVADAPLDPAALGIPFLFLPQIAALCAAERKGINPDRPDGLEAWVKL